MKFHYFVIQWDPANLFNVNIAENSGISVVIFLKLIFIVGNIFISILTLHIKNSYKISTICYGSCIVLIEAHINLS